jgi:cytochrome oxidase Cu insertion factor (SCO1/SenC/PrrC family)
VQTTLSIQPYKDFTVRLFYFALIFLGFALIVTACAPAQAVNTPVPQSTAAVVTATIPDWFDMELTDAQTGEIFTMNDYAGKVVLVETMAIWCPNCVVQGNEVRNLHKLLGNPDDLISISLDVDFNEDEASLKGYASGYGFDWHFAVAPLEVARALGNLYSAQYLNPPLSPMLIIDREGNVHQLEYGLKKAEALRKIVEPYLEK